MESYFYGKVISNICVCVYMYPNNFFIPKSLTKVMLNVTDYQTFKEEIIRILHKTLPKFGFIFDISIALIPKRHYKKRKLLPNVSHEHRSKKYQQHVSKENPVIYKKNTAS